MTDLADFLRACLDEDQQRTQELMRIAQDMQITFSDFKRLTGRDVPGWHDWPDVEAVCARVLAGIAANRAILDLHQQTECVNCEDKGRRPATSCRCCHHDGDTGGPTYYDGTCGTTRALAQPYAGQPGWNDEWTTAP